MTDLQFFGLFLLVLLFEVATFTVAIRALRASQRSVRLGESRYELLLNQSDALETLREERQMLWEELQRRSQEQQRHSERPEETRSVSSVGPQREQTPDNGSAQRPERQEWGQKYTEREYRALREELERERRASLEAQRRIAQLERSEEEQSKVQQDRERLAQKQQQLMRDLEWEREQRQKIEQQAVRRDEEQARLQEEYQLLTSELDALRQAHIEYGAERPKAYRPRWSRPLRLIVVLFGILAIWFTSLMVGLSMLQS